MSHTASIFSLKQLSQVRTGYTFRVKIESDEKNGNLQVLQPKDIANNKLLEKIAMVDSSTISSIDNHLLEDGDILIANKGIKYSIHLYNEKSLKTIASSSFFVISVDRNKILPDYLVWYLEQNPAKRYFFDKTTMTTIPTINKPVVENLLVPVPSLEIQQQAVSLINEIKKESEILKQLHEKKTELRDSYLWNLIS